MPALPSPDSFPIALAAYRAGRLDEAVEQCSRLLAADPGNINALQLLGAIHYKSRRFAAAQPLLQRAAALAPNLPSAHFNVAEILSALHRYAEAIPYYEAALRLKPDDAIGFNNLGNALRAQLRIPEALEAFRRCLSLKPDYAPAENNRGVALVEIGQLRNALEAFRAAAARDPSHPVFLNNVGNMLKELGQPGEAAAFYQRAIALKPDYIEAESNLLLCRQCDPDWTPERRLEAHRQWGEATMRRLGLIGEQPAVNFPGKPASARPRIGLVSSDFCCHPVTFFLLPLLTHRDRGHFEYVVFANIFRPDHYTEKVRTLVDGWVSTTGLNPEEIAAQVRGQKIDVLLDLGGHTGTTSITAFAYRAAPVQISYLGYPGTTGLPTMDYRLTDAWADPVGMTEAHHTERLVRLPDCAWCYEPPGESPPMAREGAAKHRPVTFGCFNTAAKWNERTFEAWVKILAALPEARLKLKGRALGDAGFREEVARRLNRSGVQRAQLDLRPMTATLAEHLAEYQEVDVALDTFPYHGTTTTCEALWMGVPVVSLVGADHQSRVGASLLRAVGMTEGLVPDWAGYIARAVDMGRRGVRGAVARAEVRSQMQASALMDGVSFARNFETVVTGLGREQFVAGGRTGP